MRGALEAAAVRVAPSMSAQNVASIIWGLATLGWQASSDLSAVLQQHVEAFAHERGPTQLSTAHLSQLLQLLARSRDLEIQLKAYIEDGTAIHPCRRERGPSMVWRRWTLLAPRDASTRAVPFDYSVMTCLTRHGGTAHLRLPCLRVCACACVRACVVCLCSCACSRTYMCVWVFTRARVRACACLCVSARVCVRDCASVSSRAWVGVYAWVPTPAYYRRGDGLCWPTDSASGATCITG
jgi:hypothetical protein